jgi:hypothetical protein
VIIGRLIPTGEVYRNRYLSEMGEKGKNVEGGGGND